MRLQPAVMFVLRWLAVVGGVLVFAPLARGDAIAVAPLRDNTIFETPAGNSHGLGEQIFAGRAGSATSRRRSLVAFDVSAIPPDATIDLVRLTLRLADVANQEMLPRTMSLHRITSNWGEGTSNAGTGSGSGSGAAATAGDATWNFGVFNTALWTSPGGDFLPLASATTSVGTLADVGTLYTWQTTGSGGLIDDVEAWLANPAANFGWLLKMDQETFNNSVRRFNSGEATNAAFRPLLEIEYTPAALVPEPAAGASFAVALVAVLAYGRLRARRAREPAK